MDTNDKIDKLEEDMGHMKTDLAKVLVPELNATAIVQTINIFRAEIETRLVALENEIATQRHLVTNQSRVIGETMAQMMGRGSTEPE